MEPFFPTATFSPTAIFFPGEEDFTGDVFWAVFWAVFWGDCGLGGVDFFADFFKGEFEEEDGWEVVWRGDARCCCCCCCFEDDEEDDDEDDEEEEEDVFVGFVPAM